MAQFYSPYYFVPAVRDGNRSGLKIKDLRDNANPASLPLDGMRHDLYEQGKHSGVISCTVEAKSPIFIGNVRQEGSVEVQGFKLAGQPALPASSLRGLISSVAEAASNSALRILGREVLGEPCYSFRKPMTKAISAVGKLVETSDGWKLEPICLPNLRYDRQGNLLREMGKWLTVFNKCPVFRVYAGDYGKIRGNPPAGPWAYRTGNRGAVGLEPLTWAKVRNIDIHGNAAPSSLNMKNRELAPTIIAQNSDPGQPMQNVIVRVLGCYEKDSHGEAIRQIPASKKHELILPYTRGRFPLLVIPQDVVDRFQQLANQMTQDSEKEDSPRPYEPKDTRPGRKQGEKLEPRAGDLVFFDVDDTGKKVTEFSYSSIWRGRVDADGKPANAWVFFERQDVDLAPLNPSRKTLTLAERIFGFVENSRGAELNNGLQWKGRVRFSHGLASETIQEMPLAALKELSGPKSPSPAMYFRYPTGENKYIAKTELNPARHLPQGRKFYLHHRGAIEGNEQPWKQGPGDTFEASRHVKIKPWSKGSKWSFKIHFDNLNDLELGLLLYSLKPNDSFLHKLGMGKPLGLGSIEITLDSVKTVDRISRYSAAGWGQPRFKAEAFDWAKLRKEFRDGMKPEILTALETIGNPKSLPTNTPIPIGYPSCDGVQEQGKHYEWFVANEDRARHAGHGGPQPEALQPVTTGGIKPLNKLPKPHQH
jgi:hypothetical protein